MIHFLPRTVTITTGGLLTHSSVAIPLNARIMADLFCLDMKTPENESGSMNAATVYKHLMNVRTWGFNNNDPGLMLQRRKWASESAEALVKSTLKVVNEQAQPQKTYILGSLTGNKQSVSTLRWYGNNVAKQMMEMDMTAAETAEVCWLTAVGGVGAPVGLVRIPHFLSSNDMHPSPNTIFIPRSPTSYNITSDRKTSTTGKRSSISSPNPITAAPSTSFSDNTCLKRNV